MQNKSITVISVLLALAAFAAGADELTDYVQSCQNELWFSASDIPSNMNCNDGVGFNVTQGTPINDYVGHAQLNAYVDLVFACRWLGAKKPAYSPTALGVEMLIHNRYTGGTCFFAAKDPTNPPEDVDPRVSTSLVSPTDTNASSYWMQPMEIENKKYRVHGVASPQTRLRCVGCHVAGPYIASNNIAPALAQFGLLNDGHDTFATRYYAVASPVRVAGISAFRYWNNFIRASNSTTGIAGCAAGCHSIGTGSIATVIPDADGQIGEPGSFPVIPSLQEQITNLADMMPPNNPPNRIYLNRSLNYTWINMGSPLINPNGEFEMLADVQNAYPRFHCANPASLSAHVVDSDVLIRTTDVPDNMYRFNLQDGVVCLNNDQPGGKCHDYQVRYMCNGRFTAFQNNDTPTGSGDWESPGGFKNLCASPTALQTRYQSGGTWVYVYAPADRLSQFDNQGLACYNADQNNGQCSNYVVQFDCQ